VLACDVDVGEEGEQGDFLRRRKHGSARCSGQSMVTV
jgi:hypothetical protein